MFLDEGANEAEVKSNYLTAGSAHCTLCPAANLLLDFSRDGANVKGWAGWTGLGWAGLELY